MNEQKWTKEPWQISCGIDESGYPTHAVCGLAGLEKGDANLHIDNADRIVACVNAMAGIDNPAAEIARLREAQRDRDELLYELKALLPILEKGPLSIEYGRLAPRIRATIAEYSPTP